jgi:hypothetical protein
VGVAAWRTAMATLFRRQPAHVGFDILTIQVGFILFILKFSQISLAQAKVFFHTTLMPPHEDDPENPYEDAPWRGVAEMLEEQGFTAVPSAQVSKYELRGRLWELIYALAGKRIFFFHTDHLSDREFYNWLEQHWLTGQAADLPPTSEWNCHVDVSESGTSKVTAERLALRYYADDAERASWQQDHPGQTLPAHQALPYKRDQTLPRPHAPITKSWPLPGFAMSLDEFDNTVDSGDDDNDNDSLPFGNDDSDAFDEENDPLGLASVDREIHRRSQVPDLGGNFDEPSTSSSELSEPFPSDFNPNEETFLRPIDVLRERGFSPLPMAELTEETVAPSLWELLHELNRMNFYVVHTDHLCDAELYQELTRSVIYQKVIIPELIETAACYHDCLHQGPDEALLLWLKYYASPEQRQDWAFDNPTGRLPTASPLPYQRDWHLPQLPVRP